jgi:hypothetical protein
MIKENDGENVAKIGVRNGPPRIRHRPNDETPP